MAECPVLTRPYFAGDPGREDLLGPSQPSLVTTDRPGRGGGFGGRSLSACDCSAAPGWAPLPTGCWKTWPWAAAVLRWDVAVTMETTSPRHRPSLGWVPPLGPSRPPALLSGVHSPVDTQLPSMFCTLSSLPGPEQVGVWVERRA